jgi:hypothetical protein
MLFFIDKEGKPWKKMEFKDEKEAKEYIETLNDVLDDYYSINYERAKKENNTIFIKNNL